MKELRIKRRFTYWVLDTWRTCRLPGRSECDTADLGSGRGGLGQELAGTHSRSAPLAKPWTEKREVSLTYWGMQLSRYEKYHLPFEDKNVLNKTPWKQNQGIFCKLLLFWLQHALMLRYFVSVRHGMLEFLTWQTWLDQPPWWQGLRSSVSYKFSGVHYGKYQRYNSCEKKCISKIFLKVTSESQCVFPADLFSLWTLQLIQSWPNHNQPSIFYQLTLTSTHNFCVFVKPEHIFFCFSWFPAKCSFKKLYLASKLLPSAFKRLQLASK